MKHDYKIGDKVYVKPNDSKVLKGVVIGFQKVGKMLPIVECENPFKKGEKFRNAFDLEYMSKTPTIKVVEWRLVEVEHKYEK